MSASEPYFQFPLSALSFGANLGARLNHVADYCMVSRGMWQWYHEMTQDQRDSYKAATKRRTDNPPGMNYTRNDCYCALIGAAFHKLVPGNVMLHVERWDSLREFITSMPAGPFVRMKTTWLLDSRNGEMFKHPLDFHVLCAVYSAIGNSAKPVRITRDMIRCRCLGYTSIQQMQELLPLRRDSMLPPTDKAIRCSIERLLERGFFVRFRPSAKTRHVYFSNRMTQEELAEAVMANWSKAERMMDQEEALRQRYAYHSGPGYHSGPKPSGRTQKGPVKGQTRATEGPLRGHYDINTSDINNSDKNNIDSERTRGGVRQRPGEEAENMRHAAGGRP